MAFRAAAISALLLVAAVQGSSFVPPPSNLTVTCHNFEIVAKWDYVGGGPLTRFKLHLEKEIKDEDFQVSVYTDQHHFNVSSLMTSVENSYYLRVKAIDGSAESDDVNSLIFSYDKFMPAQVPCLLDFPPVNLYVRRGMITVSFIHPFHLYKSSPVLRYLERKGYQEYSEHMKFDCEVVIGENKRAFQCDAEENLCTTDFPINEEREVYCVRLSGMMKNTVVNMSEAVCSREEPLKGPSSLEVSIAGCVALILIVVAGMMVMLMYKKVTWDPKVTKIPWSLKITDVLSHQASMILNLRSERTVIPQEYTNKLTVEPRGSLLQQASEKVPHTATSIGGTEEEPEADATDEWASETGRLVDVQNDCDTSSGVNSPSFTGYESKPFFRESSGNSMWGSYDRSHNFAE
ncbi:hypothetical protein GN956_G6670 [Arapaima gigas]|nr:interferon gamma receptor 1-2 [Arapaima gigas]